jgi:hypothetical protein
MHVWQENKIRQLDWTHMVYSRIKRASIGRCQIIQYTSTCAYQWRYSLMVGSLGLGASGSVMICDRHAASCNPYMYIVMFRRMHACQLEAEKVCTAVRAQRHRHMHQPRTAIAIPACRGRCGGRRCGRAAARRWRTA